MNQYTTIKNQTIVCQTVVEKSKFFCYATGIDSALQAVQFVDSIRKKHYDATHNCFAYIFDEYAKYSDDGEPQGTAGLPILECIKNKGLNRVCVVVTRYFGGIKLGAGGLVRAYSGGCGAVLNTAERLNFRPCVRFSVDLDYNALKPLQRAISPLVVVENTVFDQKVALVCLTLQHSYDTICDIVTQTSNGKAKITQIEQFLYPYPVENEK